MVWKRSRQEPETRKKRYAKNKQDEHWLAGENERRRLDYNFLYRNDPVFREREKERSRKYKERKRNELRSKET